MQAAPRFPPVALSVGVWPSVDAGRGPSTPVVATSDAHINESRVAGAGKVAFEGGGAFLRDTRREVELVSLRPTNVPIGDLAALREDGDRPGGDA